VVFELLSQEVEVLRRGVLSGPLPGVAVSLVRATFGAASLEEEDVDHAAYQEADELEHGSRLTMFAATEHIGVHLYPSISYDQA